MTMLWASLLLVTLARGDDDSKTCAADGNCEAKWNADEGFKSCLRGTAVGTDQFKDLCRNPECVREGHKQRFGDRYTPQESGAGGKMMKLIDGTVGDIEEFFCDGTNDAEAIRLVKAYIEKSRPIVFRGCANKMPGVQKWNKEYIKANAGPQFAKLTGDESTFIGVVQDLPKTLVPDLFPDTDEESPFLTFMRVFQQKHWTWASKGGRTAGTHLGSFDNLHTAVVEEKLFWVASPQYALEMYSDFINDDCPGYGNGDFGCDGFGCYNFVPFEDFSIDLGLYPEVANVPLNKTTISPGDVLLVPAFWYHHVHHRPTEPVGLNIAVAFVQQRTMMPDSPFAADIVEFWRKHDEGKVSLPECTETDCLW